MLLRQIIVLIILSGVLCPADTDSQKRKNAADEKRRNYEQNSKSIKRDNSSSDSTAGRNDPNEDYVLTDQAPSHDWSKPAPQWRDVKCDKCKGTGYITEVVGSANPVTKTKMCKECGGKGTRGKTKN
jgi:DnaJ-class molecular chaperone